MRDDTIALIAVLKAKAGQTEALRDALQALLLPTREEPGNLDYALFQLRDAPDTFYMRESRRDQPDAGCRRTCCTNGASVLRPSALHR